MKRGDEEWIRLAKAHDGARVGPTAGTRGARIASAIYAATPRLLKGEHRRTSAKFSPVTGPGPVKATKWKKNTMDHPGEPAKLSANLHLLAEAIARGDAKVFSEIAEYLIAVKGEPRALQKQLFLEYALRNTRRPLKPREIVAYIRSVLVRKYPNQKHRENLDDDLRHYVRDLASEYGVALDSKPGAPKRIRV